MTAPQADPTARTLASVLPDVTAENLDVAVPVDLDSVLSRIIGKKSGVESPISAFNSSI
jgi:hypothetical protein